MKKKGLVFFLCIVFLASFVAFMLPSTGAASSHKPVELKWVSFVPPFLIEARLFKEGVVDRINNMKGPLTIKLRGGPDVIAPYDLGAAVQKGIIDIATVPVGYYEAIVPGVGAGVLTRRKPWEERKPGGAFDYLVEMHKKGGLMYLGRVEPTEKDFYYLQLNKKVASPKDIAGLKIGGTTAGKLPAKGWGAAFVSLRMDEYYSAMERGLVHGVNSTPVTHWVGIGCHEVTKYLVDHPYYQCSVVAIMNLKKWNQLPPDQQALLIESMAKSEREAMAKYESARDKAMQKELAAGAKTITFSPADAEWFVKTAYESAWDYQMERFPGVTPKLKELLYK